LGEHDVAIVGAGPAGCAAAAQCRRLGLAPVLLDRQGEPGGVAANAFQIENYPGLEPVDGAAFTAHLAAFLDRFGLEVRRAKILQVTRGEGGYLLRGDSGDLHARTVILAVGTRPVPLPVPGVEDLNGQGLFYEVRDLLGHWQRTGRPRGGSSPLNATIVGGGEAALDYALTLARAGVRVIILVRGGTFRARGRLVHLLRRSEEIEVVFGAAPRRVGSAGEGCFVEIARDGATERLACDGILAAVGRESALADLVAELGPGVHGGIETAMHGLFVAGDARTGSLGQVGMAVGDGLAAAQRAAALLRREER
jgi:thioredoxin reductase (NADPH)